jgi:hypothetical protein
MDELKYGLLTEVLGQWKAEILESFLKSEGINVVLVQDSLTLSAYANPFAPVQVFVPKEGMHQARELLRSFEDSQEEEDDDGQE